MGKKKGKRPEPVIQKKSEERAILIMSGAERAKRMMPHYEPSFRTGKHMTEKDRPRKKLKPRDIEE